MIETLQAWQAAYPRDFVPANALSVVHNRLGQYDKAVAAAQEALRRSPDHPFAISNLAVAYRGLGRYDDARRVAQQGVRADAATMPTRRLLYQLGVMAGDPAAAQQLTWGRGQPREFDLVAAQGQIAMFEGRWREGESLYRRAAEMAQARGLPGNAAGQFAHLAWLEAIYRPGPDLDERVRRMVALGGNKEEGAAARSRVAAALGLVGRRAEALAIVASAERRAPDSTYVRTVLVPVTRASLALHDGKAADAVQALEPARDIEVGGLGALVPLYLRAEAYRQQGDWAAAAAEYERLIHHRGTDPYAPMVPLSWLGLGRVRAAMGESDGQPHVVRDGVVAVARRRQRLSAATRRAGRVRSARAGDHRPLNRAEPASRSESSRVNTPASIAHYQLLELIGQDGPIETWRARDARLQRTVAHPGAASRPGHHAGGDRPLPPAGPRRLARHPSAHLRRAQLGRGRRATVRRARAAVGRAPRRSCWRAAPWRPIASSSWPSSSPGPCAPSTGAAWCMGSCGRRTCG